MFTAAFLALVVSYNQPTYEINGPNNRTVAVAPCWHYRTPIRNFVFGKRNYPTPIRNWFCGKRAGCNGNDSGLSTGNCPSGGCGVFNNNHAPTP